MNLIKYRSLYFAISALVILPGVFFLLRFGLRPAIDFTGGSLLEVTTEQPAGSTQELQATAEEFYEVQSVQQTGQTSYLFRGKAIDNDTKNQVIAAMAEASQLGSVEELQFSTVGPTFGRETLMKMITAMAVVSIVIMLYVWKQFNELKYGVTAIAAMLHDSLVLLGVFSILGVWQQVEVDVLFVTALLTTLSFSVHDTIVVFDRIRELRRKFGKFQFPEIVNAAVIETLARSLNNSLTIIIMLLALALLGGDTIRWFAVALLVGAITGTYSSTFTAAPLLLLWDEVATFLKNKKLKG